MCPSHRFPGEKGEKRDEREEERTEKREEKRRKGRKEERIEGRDCLYFEKPKKYGGTREKRQH